MAVRGNIGNLEERRGLKKDSHDFSFSESEEIRRREGSFFLVDFGKRVGFIGFGAKNLWPLI